MRSISLTIALLLAAAPVRAQKALESPNPTRERTLWRGSWPSFSWEEGAGMVAAGVATGILALQSPPSEPRWQGGILFDDAVRSSVRLQSATGRQRSRSVNLALMGLEAFSYAGLLSFVSTRLSARERPDASECRRQHPDYVGCDTDTEAFWSGHTSIVAGSAGLVCAHHQYLPLWGSWFADASACVLASAGALVTATSRLMADRHYASDVIVGLGVGFGIGCAVPVLLHYSRETAGVALSVQPNPVGDGASLNVAASIP